MRYHVAVVVALSAFAAVASAQDKATVDPGMTRDQVIAKLGQPLSARQYESFTYLLYKNGCEKKCGMNDLVVLDSGKVVDAVFRSSARQYSGTSSSPRMISTSEAKHDAHPSAGRLAVPAPKKPTT